MERVEQAAMSMFQDESLLHAKSNKSSNIYIKCWCDHWKSLQFVESKENRCELVHRAFWYQIWCCICWIILRQRRPYVDQKFWKCEDWGEGGKTRKNAHISRCDDCDLWEILSWKNISQYIILNLLQFNADIINAGLKLL